MKNIKCIISAVVIISTTICITVSSFAANSQNYKYSDEELNRINSKVCNSVVRICGTDGVNSSLGTGFCIGEKGEDPQYILTNAHVALKDDHLWEESFVYTQAINDTEHRYAIEDVFISDIHDFAILKIAFPIIDRDPLPLSTETLTYGTPLFAVGYPVDGDEDYTYSALPQNASVTAGEITKLSSTVDYEGDGVVERFDCYYTSIYINNGNSGGPVVTQDGAAVGVAFAKKNLVSGQSGPAYVVKMQYVIDVLNSKGYPYSLADVSAKTPFDQIIDYYANNPDVVLISFVIIAFVIFAIFLIVHNTKGNQKVHTENIQVSQSDSVTKGPDDIELQLNTVYTIGRDPSANICVGDISGVSRTHCKIYVRNMNEGYVLYTTDLSKYGTTLVVQACDVNTNEMSIVSVKLRKNIEEDSLLSAVEHIELGSPNCVIKIYRKRNSIFYRILK